MNKEKTLSEVIRTHQTKEEVDLFNKKFNKKIKSTKDEIFEKCLTEAENGKESVSISTLDMDMVTYQVIKSWLKKEGFYVTEEKTFKSEGLDDIITSINVSWAKVKTSYNVPWCDNSLRGISILDTDKTLGSAISISSSDLNCTTATLSTVLADKVESAVTNAAELEGVALL